MRPGYETGYEAQLDNSLRQIRLRIQEWLVKTALAIITCSQPNISVSRLPAQVKKERGGRCNFSMRSKQIKHSNDHIKGNQARKGGGEHPGTPLWGKHCLC